MLLTLGGIKAYISWGETPLGPFRAVHCCVERLQLDNQMPGTSLPVVICPLQSDSDAALPVIDITVSMQAAGARGRTFYPYVSARAPQKVQLAVHESLIWRVWEVYQQLACTAAGSTAGTSHTALSTAAADVPIRVRLLWVSNMDMRLSFQGDPLTRPRNVAGGALSTIIDLANFQAAQLTLRGFEMNSVNMLKSSFTARITRVRFCIIVLINIYIIILYCFDLV